ncbi:MAG: outer membrane beta-barrel protein, partial [Bacteroidota bacterium]|nr:outer membrane beta-barrel protein [Bacteroidota bacterium]
MKKITILTLIALLSLGLNAQSLLPIKYGLKVGANLANITSIPNDGVENIESSVLIGVAGGFYMEIPLNDRWYINPEIIYAQ